jgi:hypothetical protein
MRSASVLLRHLAETCAAELNLLAPEDFPEWLVEFAAVSPHWDDRTNLYWLAADDPALVLKSSDGLDDDYLVVRWIGQWVVDADPVDWDAIEEAALFESSD